MRPQDFLARRGARRARAGLKAAALAAALMLAPVFPPARAQAPDDPFSSLVGKREKRAAQHARAVERFVTAEGERTFLFVNEGGEARIKFLCGPFDPRLDCRIDPEGPAEEIFVLGATRGPRGDLLFKDALGETILRIAPHGGATVAWPGETGGVGASRSYSEDEEALRLAPARRRAAHRRAQIAVAHLSALTGSPILFDLGRRPPRGGVMADAGMGPGGAPAAAAAFEAAPMTRLSRQAEPAEAAGADDPEAEEDAEPGDARVLADAVARVAGGMHLVASDPTGARVIASRIAQVTFAEGAAPALALEGDVLKVVYNPAAGLRGRLSSTEVARYLEDTL